MRVLHYKIRKCEKCENEYTPKSSTQTWCENCLKKPCLECGELFDIGKRTKFETAKFCSRGCKGKYNSRIHIGEKAFNFRAGRCLKSLVICDYCGEQVMKTNNLIGKFEKHFCGRECQAKYYQLHSDEVSGENSHRYSKIDVVCEWCGKTFKTSPSVKAKTRFCGKQCRNNWQSDMMKGENHYNWQGGKSEQRHLDMSSREYKEWRYQVFRRDEYTCRVCGNDKGGNLRAHHIREYANYPELKYVVDNGVTLCEACHKKVHYEGLDIQSEP